MCPITVLGMRISRKIKTLLMALPLAITLSGCVTIPPKPIYPTMEAGAPTSTLELVSPFSNGALTLDPFAMVIEVDGFKISKKETINKGITQIPIAAGSHKITHTGKMNGGLLYFNPITIDCVTEPGITYFLEFNKIGGIFKPGYHVEYRGWDKESSSQWPTENIVANPLFG